MRMIRVLSVVLAFVLAATAVSAQPVSARYDESVKTTEAMPTSVDELRRAGVPEDVIQSAKVGKVDAELPLEEFPQIYVDTQGTGDVRVSGTIPVPTPAPVLVLVQRFGCGACPFNLMAPIWTQSTVVGARPARIDWYRVEATPDQLGWAYGGGFDKPGIYNIKVAVYHPGVDAWLSQTFVGVKVYDLDFYSWSCHSGNDIKIVFHIDSLRKVDPDLNIFIKIESVGATASSVEVWPNAPRQIEAAFVLSPEEYQVLLDGVDHPTSVFFDGKSREKPVRFWPATGDCDHPGKG